MRKFSVENLLVKDVKLVEKKKLIIGIPCAIILIGIIMLFVYWAALGSPLNLGMDFTGGYTVQIKAGSKINEENFEAHKTTVIDFMDGYVYTKEGGDYKVRFDSRNGIRRLGSGVDTSMRIEFRAPVNIAKSDVDDFMGDLSDHLAEELNKLVGSEIPDVTVSGNTVTAKYSMAVLSYDVLLKSQLDAAGISTGSIAVTDQDGGTAGVYNTITFTVNGSADKAKLESALTIADTYSAKALATDMVGGSVSSDLVLRAITAVLIALLLMLFYIFFRFEFASGVASVIALVHDIAIMFMFMIICRVEFNSTFIAGLITILGYSINNSIIVFDRVRENRKLMYAKDKNVTSNQIANRSIIETLGRSINTTITTFIMIFMVVVVCAIGGISDMVTFGLPIIVGLAAGLFSSTLIAPSIWAVIRRRDITPRKAIFKKETKEAAHRTADQA